jgi:HEAT repeat protein
MKRNLFIACTLLAALVSSSSALAAKRAEALPMPDFTKGEKPGPAHDWTLGPTGARGWIHTANGHSHAARQILITAVAKGSPATGVLGTGDVILGMDGKNFTDDARVSLAKAITAAEADQGVLRLLRWREGKTETVDLKLAVLGRYSATAPYACEKSRRIFELGCAALAKRMGDPGYARKLNPIPRSLNALALLASGNRDYLPLLKNEAEWAAGFSTDGFATWYYGYTLIFLSEYVMATGDPAAAAGMKRLALEAAHGQSAVGTWGHKFAMPNGNLNGYGAMNAPGLPLTIGMVLAREAGVKDPDLDRAIAKAAGFLRWYANKGAVPYGDHLPFPAHEDNGKCCAAAVLFDLLGDREAAGFFAKMGAAAYSERERGHTGNYFNILWAIQGVARCGPLATGAYWQEQAWYYDLARQWDTSWVYQGAPEGEEEHGKYTNWDCSGSYLLDCSLPLKSLRLTGKKPFSVKPFDAAQTAAVIAAGRDYPYKGEPSAYEKRDTQQLLAGLTSWSPAVRKRSAAALGKRDGNHLPALLKMLASPNPDARYGAVEALGRLGPRADAAAPQLRAALKDPDPWLQSLAAEAIPALGPEVRNACVGDLLALTVRVNPADPRQLTARYAGFALFSPMPGQREPRSILATSLDGVDRELLYPAIRTLLQHQDSVPRGGVAKTFPNLTDRDLVELLPDIVKAIERLAPSNEMFGDGVRLAGLDLLSRLRIREGMELCLTVMEPERWGAANRIKGCLASLQRYGTHAKAKLPALKEARARLVAARNPSADTLAAYDQAIAAIEAATDTPELVRVAEFKAQPAAK